MINSEKCYLTLRRFAGRACAVVSVTMMAGSAFADVLFPDSFVTRSGSSSDQRLSALTTYDQTGSQDLSDDYIEFSSVARPLRSIFYFTAPAGVRPQTMAIDINFKGPAKSQQTWRVKLYSYAARTWVTVGDNAEAANRLWTQMSYPVTGDLSRFVDQSGKMQVQYMSANPRVGEASEVDYLGIRWNEDRSTTPSDPGSGSGGSTSTPSPSAALIPGTSWQMQITGAVDTTYNAQVYDIDLFDASQAVIDALHAQGRTVVCYFSAGSWEDWRPDAGKFPASVKGNSNGWPGEKWLNIADLSTLGPIMAARLDRAVQRGCDGVDPDNVDGYTNRTGFNLTATNQLAYNRFLANEAHSRGLLVGLKNDLDQVKDLIDYFDFAVNEECQQYNECGSLGPFTAQNKLVMQIEYGLSPSQFCPQANAANRDAQRKTLDLDSKVLANCRKDF